MQNLKEGELLWLVDYSVKRFEYKLERILGIFTGNDGDVQSTRVKMAHGELNRPVIKLAPICKDGVSEIEIRAGWLCWRYFKSATKAIIKQEYL